ncbi:MAG: trypsin-like peptidase domain-containing protein [Ignavibacteriae bacterium]|nr:trypsin-like peptidase domain-containing protein [Ignavibacteriota bacterium]
MKKSFKFVYVIIAVFLFSGFLFAQDKNLQAPVPEVEKKNGDLTAEEIIEQNKPALVSIWYHTNDYFSYSSYSYTYKDTVLLSGSGFIFSKEGLVGTNNHVISGFDSLFIKTSDGTFYNAEIVYVEEKNDLAILKIVDTTKKTFPFVRIANSNDVKVGQNIYAIGSPLGFEYTISEGIVAALRENEKVSFTDPDTYALVEKTFDKVIQITAAISPGNSGGALFNGKGDVIGITTYSYGFYGNLNFAIAINTFNNIVKGINFADLDNNEEYQKKRQQGLFNTNLKLAETYKNKLYSTWFYSKQIDTMKKIDTFYVKQDSLNKMYLNKAETHYNICLDLKPDTFYVYQNLMELYVFTDKFKNAEDLYKKIREKFDSDSLLNTLSSSLAEAYSTSKDYKKALTFYEKMSKVDTTDNFIRYQIAYLNEMMKDYKKAITNYNNLIKRDSNYINAYVRLGEIYYKQFKDYKKAKKYLTEALIRNDMLYDYGTGNIDLYYLLGMIAVKEKRKLDALLVYIDMKKLYLYNKEDKLKRLELLKAIQSLE